MWFCGPSDFSDLSSFGASYGTGGLVVSAILLVLINLFVLVIFVDLVVVFFLAIVVIVVVWVVLAFLCFCLFILVHGRLPGSILRPFKLIQR